MRIKHGSDPAARGIAERHAWALLAVAACAWYLPFALVPVHVGFVADDALYLMSADWMQGAWRDDPVLRYVRTANHLPPFYPLVLALAGGGSAQIDIAHLVQNLCLVAGLVAHGLLARRLIGSSTAAVLLAATLLLLPLTVIMATEIWSEFLYLLLIALALISADAARERGGWWLAAAACAGLAAVTRSFGIVAVIALVIAVAWRRPRWSLPVLLTAIAPLLAVEALNLGGGSNYVDVFIERVQTPSRFLAFVAANLVSLDAALWQSFALPRPAFGGAIVALALLPVLRTLFVRLRAGHVDALYVVGYLGLLAIWPFAFVLDRLLYPLVPLLLIYLLAGLNGPGAGHRDSDHEIRRYLPPAAAAVLLAVTLGQVVPLAERYRHADLPDELARWRASRYWMANADAGRARDRIERLQAITALLARAGERVPVRQCINSDHPQAVMFHARRLSWPVPGAADRGRARCRFRLLTAPLPDSAPAPLSPGGEVVDRAAANGRLVGILVDYRSRARG